MATYAMGDVERCIALENCVKLQFLMFPDSSVLSVVILPALRTDFYLIHAEFLYFYQPILQITRA